jgi:hypothetical protein
MGLEANGPYRNCPHVAEQTIFGLLIKTRVGAIDSDVSSDKPSGFNPN